MRFAALLLLAAIAAPAGASDQPVSPAIARAVTDPSRPAEDKVRDANRKPAETLAFLGVKPGMKIADYIANSGYFTRLFTSAVGPTGHVYAVELNEVITFPNVTRAYGDLRVWAVGRRNVSVPTWPVADSFKFPEPLDLFWIAQNYHDLHDTFLGPQDIATFNAKVFAALKPGGIYAILDHSALSDAPADVTETLHRIQRDRVIREVTAAGFELVDESKLLANPADPRDKGVFNVSIRGKTDQFLLKFRKPLR